MAKKKLDLISKIQTVKESLQKCPERIELSEIENSKMYKTIDTQGKLLWYLAEVLFWNSRKYLIQLFEEYLPNKRDPIPVLDSISKSRGFIKSTKDSMIVILEALERPQFRQAQCQLCKKLNHMNILMPNNKLLLFCTFVSDKYLKKGVMNPISFNIEVKPDILVSLNKSETEFSKEIKLWAAISLFQFNKLSLAKAASFAGYHRYDFENILSELNIPISNLDIVDIKKDIKFLNTL